MMLFGVLLPLTSLCQMRKSDFYNNEYSPSGKKTFRKLYQANENLLQSIIADSSTLSKLSPLEITNIFYHLKKKGCYISEYNAQKREEVIKAKKILIDIAPKIIKYTSTPDTLKLEARDFLNQLIENKCINNVSSVDEILKGLPKSISVNPPPDRDEAFISLDPVLKEKNRVEWTLIADSKEPMREKCFTNFLDCPKCISADSLNIIAEMCKARKEYLRYTLLISEKLRRMPQSTKITTEHTAGISLLPKDLYQFYTNTFHPFKAVDIQKLGQDSAFAICYSDMLLKNEQFNDAANFLKNASINSRTKYNHYQAIYKSQGLENAIDFLYTVKARSKSIERLLFDLNKEISNEKVISTTRYLKMKYAASLDTINITTLGGYWRDKDGLLIKNGKLHKSTDEQGIFYLASLYAKYGYTEESFELQNGYWQFNKPNEAVIDKQVLAKKMSPFTASDLLYNYGKSCVEDDAKGSRNRELIKSTCLPLLLKAYKYDSKNYDVCKEIGFAYSYLGDGNSSQKWLELAESLGADMSDAKSAGKGKGNIKTGSRGGKYYINGNGNKTYVK